MPKVNLQELVSCAYATACALTPMIPQQHLQGSETCPMPKVNMQRSMSMGYKAA